MTRALILFTKESVDEQKAYPDILKSLLESALSDALQVDVAVYDDLIYTLTSGSSQIAVGTTGRDIAEYDVVYLRRIKESTAQAIAVGKYGVAKGVAVIDEEIATRPGSMGKLTQYLQLSLSGLPFPDTIYASSHDMLLKHFANWDKGFPLILKSVSGSRGNDNYLIKDQSELVATLHAHPKVHFLIQQYIPNTADYRVWVCGDEIGPILYRTRTTGHTNNTSQGGAATLIDDHSVLPANVLEACVQAAQCFKRDIAGVDVVFENDDTQGRFYFFEVNRAPQIELTPYADIKAAALAHYFVKKAQERHQS